ncbi:MAG TPA: DUF3307 domain-containing protein [Flavipsychrobacter sp.]|nr:DUF3307 domain-containing protein [Flavipsychrobacter sp.]
MNWLLVAQLFTLHVIGDFILQPGKWVQSRNEKHFRSPYLYFHALIHVLIALIFTASIGWWLAVVIGLGHLTLDGLKSYLKRNDLIAFIVDQLLHLLIIFLGVAIISQTDLVYEFSKLLENEIYWWRSFGFLLVVALYPKLISFATKQWRKDIPPEREKLYKAGRWIGIIERVLVLSFVLIQQFGAVGFLLAAKSVFRFGDLKEGRDKGHTEYVLIGTLLSFGLTILTGLFINWITKTID